MKHRGISPRPPTPDMHKGYAQMSPTTRLRCRTSFAQALCHVALLAIFGYASVSAGGTGGGEGQADPFETFGAVVSSVYQLGRVAAAAGEAPPSSLFLDQNSPNPFNPSTRIRYGLPEAGHVRLTVYTLVGRPIAVLVDGWLEAGIYQASFEANEVPSGVYFYRLQTPWGSVTRRMTISR